jgi:hypothetical protein
MTSKKDRSVVLINPNSAARKKRPRERRVFYAFEAVAEESDSSVDVDEPLQTRARKRAQVDLNEST